MTASDILSTDKHWKAFYKSKRPCMVDLLVDEDIGSLSYWFSHNFKKSELVEGAYEAANIKNKLKKSRLGIQCVLSVLANPAPALVSDTIIPRDE